MTTEIVYADSTDGTITSSSSSYSSALSGANLSADTDEDTGQIGQEKDGSTYRIYQLGIAFTPIVGASTTLTAAYLRLYQASIGGTGVARNIEIAEYDWGGALDTGNWRTPSQLNSLVNGGNLAARIDNAHTMSIGQLRAGLEPGHMPDLDSPSTLRYLLYTSRNRAQQTPSGSEYHTVRLTERSGTSQDPAMVRALTTKHLMDVSLGGQVQLSDGTHAYLKQGKVAPAIETLALVHHDGTSATTVHTAPITPGRNGAQTYTLVVDDDDNLYVLNGNTDIANTLRARAFTKKSGHNWTVGPVYNIPLPSYNGDVINVAGAWHTAGSGGTILAVVARDAGRNTGTQIAYALLNCQYLRTGSGSLLRGSGDAEGVLVAGPAADGAHNYVNETGTLLDVAAAPSSRRGFVVCTTKAQVLGDAGAQSFARYELNASGTGFASTTRLRDTTGAFSTKDADAKSRVLPIDDSQFVTVNADSTTGRGLTVVHRQSIGTGAITELSRVLLEAEDLASMPAPSTLATSSAWDAVYNPVDNRVWLYYFDNSDGQRLLRTAVNLTTGQAGQDEVEVDDAVGASGSTNHAIRVHRGDTETAQILITVANQTSGGTQSLLTVVDRLNSLPTQPVVTPKSNFDADSNATFEWEFTDPDAGDSQSAFQVEIYDTSDGTLAHDSTKTTSSTESYTLTGGTLSNDADYRWRVRTWDQDDEESPWSDFDVFTTSDSGSVTITDPATDNDPDIITADYEIKWQVTGTTQADYRVVVARTDTLAELVDTDWVTSSDTSYLVEGMAAGVEYLVKVTVRDAVQVESNTAERLITPNYAAPETPLISVEAFDDDGYVLVTVTNPEPQGDRPNPDSNQIFRRRADSGDPWVLLSEIDPDSTYRDYTAPSGVEVEYIARAGVN